MGLTSGCPEATICNDPDLGPEERGLPWLTVRCEARLAPGLAAFVVGQAVPRPAQEAVHWPARQPGQHAGSRPFQMGGTLLFCYLRSAPRDL